jgi:formylglycine-generating enzyme required for sulfatase activity
MKHVKFTILITGLCLAAATVQAAITVDMVTVGNPGNAADDRAGYGGYGKVDYSYKIGTYEVTNAQYVAFLNAVAADDTYGLYNTNMWSNAMGCKIERLGTAGSYTYQVAADRANRPVNYVSWGDSARFINWLHNNQPTGAQGLGTTEDGAYYLNGANSIDALGPTAIQRKTGAKYFIPTIDEWYKAAFYDPQKAGGPGYWDYATRTNDQPGNQVLSPDTGNNANYKNPDYTLGSPYYFTPVGEFENSAGAYGTFDQDGNVCEWLGSGGGTGNYGDSYYFYKGGSFVHTFGSLKASDTKSYNPMTENFIMGIRVAAPVPEPGTLALLFSALAAAAWLWKRHVNYSQYIR